MFTTVEIIVDEREKARPGVSHNALHAFKRSEPVALQVAYDETSLRKRVKEAGGRWSRAGRAWVMRRDVAVGLGLAHRISEGLVETCTDIDTSIAII